MSSFGIITPSPFPKDASVSSEQSPPSPTSPAYSPITPTMSTVLPTTNNGPIHQHPYRPPSNPQTQNASAYTQNAQPPAPSQIQGSVEFESPVPQSLIQQPLPPSQPISLSDNPDAIALRAAMSVLQIQRQQALRDMKTLETQKTKALENPEAFARAVSEGKIKARGTEGIIPAAYGEFDGDGAGYDDDAGSEAEKTDGNIDRIGNDKDDFGTLPSAQNVVRMPPVNWNKYHIVGESLDKLHEEQRARPSPGRPLRDEDLRPQETARESVIAAPYDPWMDKLGKKPLGRKSAAKRKS